ncbi:MAG: hypothetical protein QXO37_06950 [Candidatus Nitrosocaldaceae archaeon]
MKEIELRAFGLKIYYKESPVIIEKCQTIIISIATNERWLFIRKKRKIAIHVNENGDIQTNYL